MSFVRLVVPEDVVLASGMTREGLAAETQRLLAYELFRSGRLSAGKAAELSGGGQAAFLEEVSRRGIPVAELDEDELAEELRHVDQLARSRQ